MNRLFQGKIVNYLNEFFEYEREKIVCRTTEKLNIASAFIIIILQTFKIYIYFSS